MKSIIIIIIALFGLNSTPAHAQVSFSFNIGAQPLWGPVGYDYVRFYYIPAIDAYYDVNEGMYVYDDDGRWIYSYTLPPRYRDIDLYRVHKVVINESRPWLHHRQYWSRYHNYRGRQTPIRDSRSERYWANPHHPHHAQWHGDLRHGNGENHHYEHHSYHYEHQRGRGNGHNNGHGHNNGQGHEHHHH